ncbi:MAG TPA: hypothetical protein VFN18_04960 [Solirubrobacterales bacterium]|nr:hypothetical protein [Solirubrobacterales bacterium]
MSQSLECPHCHARAQARRTGWSARACPVCGAPMVLAAAPAEALVRKYLHGDRLANLPLPPRERRT